MRNVYQEIKSTLLWIALATVVGLVGLWQVKVAIGRDMKASHVNLPPPLKTRHATRPPHEDFTGDVVEDYTTRCKKGLTDQQIAWILTDFRNAGLALLEFTDKTSDDELVAYRKAQQRWYLGALKDGLRLTAAQASEAARKLDDILLSATSEFPPEKKEAASSGPIFALFDFPSTRYGIVLSYVWLFSAYDAENASEFRCLPWDLCTLTPGQSEITRKNAFSQLDNSHETKVPQLPAQSLQRSFQTTQLFDDDVDLPERFAMADAIFPYLKSQEFVVNEDPGTELSAADLENIRRLHPAQLKATLLFYPELAEEIQSALDKGSR